MVLMHARSRFCHGPVLFALKSITGRRGPEHNNNNNNNYDDDNNNNNNNNINIERVRIRAGKV